MARVQGARATLAAAFENTYGTSPNSGYKKMPFASCSLGAEQALIDSNILGVGRDKAPPILDRVNVDGNISIPIDTGAFGFWLKAAFGSPVTTGTTSTTSGGTTTTKAPYTHKFVSGKWDLPSFSAEIAMPEASRYARYSGCKLNELSWDFGTQGTLDAEVSIIAQGEEVATKTAVGTLSEWSQKRFGNFHGAIERAGVAMGNVVSASIKYSNNLDRIETIRSDGKISGVDPSIADLSGALNVRFEDSTLVDQAINGQSCSLVFSYTISATEKLTFTIAEVYLPRPRLSIDGPEGVQVSFDWQAAKSSGTANMVSVEYINAVAGY